MAAPFCAALICLAVQSSDADIQALAAQVSQPQYSLYQHAIENMGLGQYGGALYNQNTRGRAWTGNVGDKGNQESRKYLLESFAGLGLKTAVQGRYYNVVAELTGAVHPENVIILCAHYDTRKSNTPGGDGDASGVAGLLEAARVLSQSKFDNTIRFIAFNAAEKRFRGSDDYAFRVITGGKDKLVGVVDLNQILHPYHDKNTGLAPALAVGVGSRGTVGTAWSSAFVAAAQQFVPELALDSGGPVIDAASDHYSFVANGYSAALRLSENSGKDKANASIGTSADASDAAAGANYDFAFATNVVRAAVAFLAQQANFGGPADSSGSSFPDSDGDGFSDEIETALETDPASAASTPLGIPAVLPSGELELLGMVLSLSFSDASADGISIAGLLPVPAGFSSKGTNVIVDVGGVVRAFSLGTGGAGKKGTNVFSLKVKTVKKSVPAQLARFSCTFASGNFKKQFARFGMGNGNIVEKPVLVPVTVIFANDVRTATRILIYSATNKMGGAAR